MGFLKKNMENVEERMTCSNENKETLRINNEITGKQNIEIDSEYIRRFSMKTLQMENRKNITISVFKLGDKKILSTIGELSTQQICFSLDTHIFVVPH